ncbi:hypothetical protein Sjap_004850 [Stephania japonica]|uniref:Uncharacterized protein n=1 Tax=Stephania japonica TaxID=461633 RepID=A0AAP0K589_9MAGN
MLCAFFSKGSCAFVDVMVAARMLDRVGDIANSQKKKNLSCLLLVTASASLIWKCKALNSSKTIIFLLVATAPPISSMNSSFTFKEFECQQIDSIRAAKSAIERLHKGDFDQFPSLSSSSKRFGEKQQVEGSA